jgi:hypothetical protein
MMAIVVNERTATNTHHDEASVRRWPRRNRKRRCPFGGYEVCFKGQTETHEELFGSAPMPSSQMTKKLWEFVKRHKLATKG